MSPRIFETRDIFETETTFIVYDCFGMTDN